VRVREEDQRANLRFGALKYEDTISVPIFFFYLFPRVRNIYFFVIFHDISLTLWFFILHLSRLLSLVLSVSESRLLFDTSISVVTIPSSLSYTIISSDYPGFTLLIFVAVAVVDVISCALCTT